MSATVLSFLTGKLCRFIKALAEKGDCVIVGRGADFILKDQPKVLNIFIKADMAYKVKEAKANHDLDDKDARIILLKRDKERANHYYYYTGRKWGDIKNYDLVLDSSKLGVDGCIDLIVAAYNKLK